MLKYGQELKYLKILMTKVIVLFSGGLDSILAAQLLKEQKLEVNAICFKSCFFNGEKAKIAAKDLCIPLKIIDFSKKHLEIVKSPKYGYGKNMNPCIDCHILMLKEAKKMMSSFVATGEVLGQRPMSQNKNSLKKIEKESGLEEYLLRPLSAKLLDKTIPEKNGIVDRKKLLNISGRSRRKQIALAKKFNLKRYPSPSGGCLLTDPEFSKRLRKLSNVFPEYQKNDIELLKIGRHFWKDKIKIIIGRDEKENKRIKKIAKNGDTIIEIENYPSPITLIRPYGKGEYIRYAKKLTQYYSTKARERKDIKFKFLEIKDCLSSG